MAVEAKKSKSPGMLLYLQTQKERAGPSGWGDESITQTSRLLESGQATLHKRRQHLHGAVARAFVADLTGNPLEDHGALSGTLT